MIYLISSCARQSLSLRSSPATHHLLTRNAVGSGNGSNAGIRRRWTSGSDNSMQHTIEKGGSYSSCDEIMLCLTDPKLLLVACISIGSLLQYQEQCNSNNSNNNSNNNKSMRNKHATECRAADRVAATSMAHQLASVSAAHSNVKQATATKNHHHHHQYAGDYVWTMNVNGTGRANQIYYGSASSKNKVMTKMATTTKQQFGSGRRRTGTTCTAAAGSTSTSEHDTDTAYNDNILPAEPVLVSVRALRGGRFHMEDEYFIGDNGRFVGVFDGHGGGGVSSYLREQLHAAFQKYLRVIDTTITSCPSPTIGNCIAALRAAFNEVDTKVLLDDDLKDQGSTAVCCILHEDVETGKKTLLSANVGDSRAVLSRNQEAIDLTEDHKPGNRKEYARIKELGGEREIEYDYAGGFYRVGNLSVSRAIGDRFARPLVSGQVDIRQLDVQEDEDEFIVLASDGLYDVMSSQGVVNFVHEKLRAPLPDGFPIENEEMLHALMEQRRKKVSKFLAKEAVRRGSMDNICVVIVWLKNGNEVEQEFVSSS